MGSFISHQAEPLKGGAAGRARSASHRTLIASLQWTAGESSVGIWRIQTKRREHCSRSRSAMETISKPTRELISYTQEEKRCLESLASMGLLATANVEPMLRFRDNVLQRFNNLVDAEMLVACHDSPDANEKNDEANPEAESDPCSGELTKSVGERSTP